MKTIIVISLMFTLFCQNNQECRSGTIFIKSHAGKTLIKTRENDSKQELPGEFSFSSSDMVRAIAGYWVNSNNDTTIHIFIDDSSIITWNIGVEGYKCGPTFAAIHFTVSNYPDSNIISEGEIMFYNTLIEGEATITKLTNYYRMTFHSNDNLTSCFLIYSSDLPEYKISKGDSLKLLR